MIAVDEFVVGHCIGVGVGALVLWRAFVGFREFTRHGLRLAACSHTSKLKDVLTSHTVAHKSQNRSLEHPDTNIKIYASTNFCTFEC